MTHPADDAAFALYVQQEMAASPLNDQGFGPLLQEEVGEAPAVKSSKGDAGKSMTRDGAGTAAKALQRRRAIRPSTRRAVAALCLLA